MQRCLKGNACLDGMVCTPAAKSGETVKQYRKRVKSETNGKTKPRIEKPQLTFVNRWMLEQPVSVKHPFDANEVQFVAGVVKMYRNKDLMGRRVRLMMYPNEIAVRFRLDLNLEIQLSKAKTMLAKAGKRFKEEARRENEDNNDSSVVTNLDGRIGRKILDAHFWLRSFDAFNEPRKHLDDSNHKRKQALKAGPSEIAKKFKSECTKKTFSRGVVEAYNTSAKGMIGKQGYQKLVVVFEPASTKRLMVELAP